MLPIGIQNLIRNRAMHTHTQPESHHRHPHHHHQRRRHHQQQQQQQLEEVNDTQAEQKRSSSSSMIFRIEQLLPNASSTGNSSTSSSIATTTTAAAAVATSSSLSTTNPTKRLRNVLRPGVYTLQYTPKDTCSNIVPTSDLLSSSAMPTDITRSHCQISATNGELIMSATLLRQIKLSEDIYSFNAIFELNGGQVRIRLVRDVARDDEIVAWFGEELVLLMGIPFLTPLNIQGNNRYTCHLCHLTFETPHPLKIHLALGCGRSSMDILWMRLHYALKAAAQTTQTVRQLSPKPTASSTSSASPTHSPPPPTATQAPQIQRFSAFRPISAIQTLTPPPAPPAAAAPPMPTVAGALSYLPSISMATAAASSVAHPHLNAAAQIEAIVSNMGASKQGHLCIYCGKVYSRKYGLKIHIRTHTGFKPLKCKFCLRPFGDPSNLNKHVRLHLQTQTSSTSGHSSDVDIEGETDADRSSHQCRLCQKGFARRRDLQRHMETRHGGGGGGNGNGNNDPSIQPSTTSTITGATSSTKSS